MIEEAGRGRERGVVESYIYCPVIYAWPWIMGVNQFHAVIAGSSSALSVGGELGTLEARTVTANTANQFVGHTELGKCKHDKQLLAPVQDWKLSRIRTGLDSH